MRLPAHNNQSGMIMVLAMFVLALLSMIGVASMMTSTTDIEIATGERQNVETFYRSQAAHTITGELVMQLIWDRGLQGFDSINPDGDRVDFKDIDDFTFAFRLLDPDMILEPPDSVPLTTPNGKSLKVWRVDEQTVDDRDESIRYRDFYDGIQWTSEEVDELLERGQPILVKNLIAPKVNFVLGAEAENRVSPKAFPRTDNHDVDAECVTDGLRAAVEEVDFDQVRSAVASVRVSLITDRTRGATLGTS